MGRQRERISQIFSGVVLLACLGCGSSAGQTPPSYIPPEMAADIAAGAAGTTFTTTGLNQTMNGNEWLQATLFGAPNRADPRLPNYAYFQGILQAKKHLLIAGQVRVVGGVLGSDNGVASFYAGAMVTTNPYAFTGAGPVLTGGPNGIRTRVGHWEEIPTP